MRRRWGNFIGHEMWPTTRSLIGIPPWPPSVRPPRLNMAAQLETEASNLGKRSADQIEDGKLLTSERACLDPKLSWPCWTQTTRLGLCPQPGRSRTTRTTTLGRCRCRCQRLTLPRLKSAKVSRARVDRRTGPVSDWANPSRTRLQLSSTRSFTWTTSQSLTATQSHSCTVTLSPRLHSPRRSPSAASWGEGPSQALS